MRVGVVSDTHRNKDLLETVAGWLTENQRIASLYHLGDDYEDVVGLAGQGIEVVQVPGIYHAKYRDGTLKPTAWENVMGVRVLLAHSLEKDVTDEDRAVTDIILYGHTHKPELRLEDGLLYMNPGHLKGTVDKTTPASFGLLDVGNREVTATIFDLSFDEIQSIHMIRSETGLYRG
ncbi:MAG: hypothetical protein GF418_00560 [Chitinivibrionales bacterium]|nr:hypothetical protein [Chitinivibrionales bacterium]MBD3394092.1 hypothetical protein [Chitinivibrionales bacterium]